MPLARAYFTQLLLGTLHAALLAVPAVHAAAPPCCCCQTICRQWGLHQWRSALQQHRENLYWLAAMLMAGTLAWFYYGMGRVIVLAKPRWRAAYQTTTLLYMLVMSYGVAIAVVTATRPHYQQCGCTPKKLNGGLRHYRGEHFMVELCGTGSDAGRRDHIRLRIFDEQGARGTILHRARGGPYPHLIDYARDHLAYFDASEGEDEDFVSARPHATHAGRLDQHPCPAAGLAPGSDHSKSAPLAFACCLVDHFDEEREGPALMVCYNEENDTPFFFTRS
jgi:hypothetical protein